MSYLVCQFSKPTVTNLVKECFGSDFPDIFGKQQLEYLYHYLADLGASSVLLEKEYLDKDYLEDYLRYYAKCFKNSGHKCARLHFFSSHVDHSVVSDALALGPKSDQHKTISDSYLGFIVVKPLPMTFIGKTCLKNYAGINQPSSGKVCISRSYKADLFGIKLSVDSVAFQEQDKVVSACATTAIWVALHAIRREHEKQIPSCSEITGNAINHIIGSNNSFPNSGLSNKQILRALDVAGQRYHIESLKPPAYQEDSFFEAVKVHIDSGLPLILGADLYATDPDVDKQLQDGKSVGRGHAVTIVGYKCHDDQRALYVHDDRLGPFAKATLQTIDGRVGLALRRKDEAGHWQNPHELLVPTNLIIATNKKARIPYELPRNTCRMIIDEYRSVLKRIEGSIDRFNNAMTYSLRLAEVSDIRQEIIKIHVPEESSDKRSTKLKFLTRSYARFQWVATFQFEGQPAFLIMFDATDIPQGNAVSGLFVYDEVKSSVILDKLRKAANHRKKAQFPEERNFFGALLRFLRDRPRGLAEHLDNKYGELRAPKYVKPQEISEGNITASTSKLCFYDRSDRPLAELFGSEKKLLWAISEDGGLLIGVEFEDQGHPSLTGFKPARIAGELLQSGGEADSWVANSKSGRYSGDYANKNDLFSSAVDRINTIFPNSTITVAPISTKIE